LDRRGDRRLGVARPRRETDGWIRAELAVRPTARWVAPSLFNLAITPCSTAERRRTASIYIAGGCADRRRD
jgi:hypothetical protein